MSVFIHTDNNNSNGKTSRKDKSYKTIKCCSTKRKNSTDSKGNE